MSDDPVHEARALLLQLERSSWKRCEVRIAGFEMLVSRESEALGGLDATATYDLEQSAAGAPLADGFVLTAPHLGALTELAPVGAVLATGAVWGRLAVLDETRDLIAETGGAVLAHRAVIGALVEYGQPLLSIAA